MNLNNQFSHFHSTCWLVFTLKEMNECITCRTISHRAEASRTKTEGGGRWREWSCIVSIGNIAHFTRQRMNGYIDNAEGALRHFLNKAS